MREKLSVVDQIRKYFKEGNARIIRGLVGDRHKYLLSKYTELFYARLALPDL
jgi:hypothetical protein